jgi:hypothetical protein
MPQAPPIEIFLTVWRYVGNGDCGGDLVQALGASFVASTHSQRLRKQKSAVACTPNIRFIAQTPGASLLQPPGDRLAAWGFVILQNRLMQITGSRVPAASA